MHDLRALSSDDLDLLRRTAWAAAAYMRVNLAGVLLLACAAPGLAVGVFTTSMDSTSQSLLLLFAVGILALAVAIALKTCKERVRLLRPLRQALAGGQGKSVTEGLLDRVDRDGSRLRYVIGGQAIALRVALGLDTTISLLTDRLLRGIRHLPHQPVALHWLPLAEDDGLLLKADYPLAGPAVRSERSATPADRARARRGDSLVMLVLAAFAAAAVAFTAVATDFKGIAIVCVTLIAGLFWLGAAAVLWLPGFIRQRACTRLETVTGPVTEIITARVKFGKSGAMDLHWYRVAGTLICPFGMDARPGLGQTVRIQHLVRAGGGSAEGVLVDFSQAPG
ncbi:MAG: hypothetical protein QM586_17265 [Xenophilus sp.]